MAITKRWRKATINKTKIRTNMTLNKFYDWLEEKDAFHPFLRNTIKQNSIDYTDEGIDKYVEDVLKRKSEDIIAATMLWKFTPEGNKYWNKLHNEFRKDYNEL